MIHFSQAFLRLSILSLFQIFSLSAEAKESCQQVFYYSGSITAEPQSPAWLAEHRGRAYRYIKNTKNFKLIQQMILDGNQKPKDMTSPLETPDFTVRIVDQGLASRKPVQVILIDKKTEKEEVLLTSLKLKGLPEAPTIKNHRNNNTVVPVEMQLSPLKDYLLVKVSAKGNIDSFTMVLIRLSDRKIIKEFENVDNSSAVWMKPNSFVYSELQLELKAEVVTIENSGLNQRTIKDPNISGSPDQQWFYQRVPEGYRIVSTVDKTAFSFKPDSPIESILKTSQSEHGKILWIKFRGKNGFKSISRVLIHEKEQKIYSKEVIAESDWVIEDVEIHKESLIVSKYLGIDRAVEARDINGQILDQMKVPGCCAVALSEYKVTDREFKVVLQSAAHKFMDWIYKPLTNEWFRVEKETRISANPSVDMMKNASGTFVTKYESVRSKDGTAIPVRITHREGVLFDGNAPVLMEAYGGFALNNYVHPYYEQMTSEFLKAGGVHVAPAVRGSYYFGKRWHDEGRALNKQNVIDDFIGTAEWLIQSGITRGKRIAISGASHGGLLVGAAITQRPELFGLAFPQYGPQAFHDKPTLDPYTTPYQVSEYGDLIKDPAAIANARNISPELRTIPQEYPMTVVITGRQDSRVNPIHSYRFTYELLQDQTGGAPIFLYSNTNSGHWMNSIQRQDFIGWRTKSDFWSFIFDFMGLRIQPPPN